MNFTSVSKISFRNPRKLCLKMFFFTNMVSLSVSQKHARILTFLLRCSRHVSCSGGSVPAQPFDQNVQNSLLPRHLPNQTPNQQGTISSVESSPFCMPLQGSDDKISFNGFCNDLRSRLLGSALYDIVDHGDSS